MIPNLSSSHHTSPPAATTAKSRLKIKGTASDASSIQKVRFKLAKDGFKKARGTEN